MELTEKMQHTPTPYYYYNTGVLKKTLAVAMEEAQKYDYQLYYAVKANANPVLLKIIAASGMGADCVSGNEIARALACGFPASRIFYAGVGKTDDEIRYSLEQDIFCFNCESLPEIRVIDELAGEMGKKARIALRINPNVDAHTHHYITTGIEENKFGIYLYDLERVLEEIRHLEHIQLAGLHFHIGSQITDLTVFRGLCLRANEIQRQLKEQGYRLPHINFGGGLGIDYNQPYGEPIANFAGYFATFYQFFEQDTGQQVHFEPGRSIVAHCGDLISRVVYVKEGKNRRFAILDAGMSDLLRPALYQAFHKIENLSSDLPAEEYDVVGPICESADCFGKNVTLNSTRRGDWIAIHTAGAYGETMASQYNLRRLPGTLFSE